MGFMDKAKKLAEQAQQKLDEAQQNFNKGGSTPGQPGAGAGPRYDEHGRPIQENAPTGAPTAPTSPAAEAPTPDPAAPEPKPDPAPSAGEANATPDPFKPLQQ
jgi:hypothetical protein